MKNKTYDVLKWIALTGIPGASALYFAVAKIWNLPYAEEIMGTAAAIETALGTWLGISSNLYSKKIAE